MTPLLPQLLCQNRLLCKRQALGHVPQQNWWGLWGGLGSCACNKAVGDSDEQRGSGGMVQNVGSGLRLILAPPPGSLRAPGNLGRPPRVPRRGLEMTDST